MGSPVQKALWLGLLSLPLRPESKVGLRCHITSHYTYGSTDRLSPWIAAFTGMHTSVLIHMGEKKSYLDYPIVRNCHRNISALSNPASRRILP